MYSVRVCVNHNATRLLGHVLFVPRTRHRFKCQSNIDSS